MKNKVTLPAIGLLLAALGLAGYWLNGGFDQQTVMSSKTKTSQPRSAEPRPASLSHLAVQRDETKDAFVEDSEYIKDEAEAAVSFWTVITDTQAISLTLPPQIETYAAIAVQPQSQQDLFPGKQTQFVLPGEGEVSVTIAEVSPLKSGGYRWTGHLTEYGDQYPAVSTSGKTSAFAMITTPLGSYSMESVNGLGWIYKNPSEQQLSTPGHIDGIEPRY